MVTMMPKMLTEEELLKQKMLQQQTPVQPTQDRGILGGLGDILGNVVQGVGQVGSGIIQGAQDLRQKDPALMKGILQGLSSVVSGQDLANNVTEFSKGLVGQTNMMNAQEAARQQAEVEREREMFGRQLDLSKLSLEDKKILANMTIEQQKAAIDRMKLAQEAKQFETGIIKDYDLARMQAKDKPQDAGLFAEYEQYVPQKMREQIPYAEYLKKRSQGQVLTGKTSGLFGLGSGFKWENLQ